MKHGLTLAAANFTTDIMKQAVTEKVLRKELADTEPSITNLGKFDLDNFNAHEDTFFNLLGQTYGILKEPLCYIVHLDAMPTKFANTQEECMFQLLPTRDAYQLNNHTIYWKLKAFLIHSPGWEWIKPHDTAKDGHAAFKAWAARYNGGELSYHNCKDEA